MVWSGEGGPTKAHFYLRRQEGADWRGFGACSGGGEGGRRGGMGGGKEGGGRRKEGWMGGDVA